jgi:mRNA-degrading endonuclease YafQ of YafQ-DinJ toxin-antitoxin module
LQLKRTKRFVKDYAALPDELRGRTEKAISVLLKSPHHSSLRIKKMEGRQDIWELRVSYSYRLTFQISGDTYILRRVGTHDVLKKP